MAAIHSAESPKRQDSSVEEVEEPGGRVDVCESEYNFKQTDTTSSIKSVEKSYDGEASVGSDGDYIASHSQASNVSKPQTEADTTTCNSLEKLTSIVEKAHNPDVSSKDPQDFNWSEDDDVEVITRKGETGNSGMLTSFLYSGFSP